MREKVRQINERTQRPKVILTSRASAPAQNVDVPKKAMPKGGAKVGEVFEIVTHARFVTGVSKETGRRIFNNLRIGVYWSRLSFLSHLSLVR